MSDAIRSIHERLAEFHGSPVGYGVQLRNLLARLIVDRLDELGWTQARLADEMDVPESFVSRLIHSNSNCQFDVAGRVLHALQLPAVLAPRNTIAEAKAEVQIVKSFETKGKTYGTKAPATTQSQAKYTRQRSGEERQAYQLRNPSRPTDRYDRQRSNIAAV